MDFIFSYVNTCPENLFKQVLNKYIPEWDQDTLILKPLDLDYPL